MSFSKKIYDSVHGFIRLTELEKELIDSLPFQRLHYIHQLGIAYLVYPGATHTRFEHSLGVMELASRMFDQILSKYAAVPDHQYWKQVIRFACLCHDLGHLPFSHVAEKELMGNDGHEKWSLKFIQSPYLAPIWAKFQHEHPGKRVVEDIIKMSLGEKKIQTFGESFPHTPFTSWERVLCEVLSGDFFGADRIDYLLRDAQCTGVSYGLFDYQQLIEMVCILPSPDGKGLKLGIEENGIESCEALLLARHFMHRRVYQYPSVKAYAFHMSRFMGQTIGPGELKNIESYLALTESEVLTALSQAAKNPKAKGHKEALYMTQRSLRFCAFELPEWVTEDDLKKWKQRQGIQDGHVEWEFSGKKRHQFGLSFPVIKRNQAIVDASLCSDLHIPAGGANYIYLDPTYESQLHKWLEAYQSNKPGTGS